MNAPAIKEDEDPRYKEATQELSQLIMQYMGAPITYSMIDHIEEVIEEFRATWRIRGLEIPRLVIVALPLAGYIQVWPAEMEHKVIQLRIAVLVKQLRQEGRNYDPFELSKAIRRAYPDYSPSTSLKLK